MERGLDRSDSRGQKAYGSKTRRTADAATGDAKFTTSLKNRPYNGKAQLRGMVNLSCRESIV